MTMSDMNLLLLFSVNIPVWVLLEPSMQAMETFVTEEAWPTCQCRPAAGLVVVSGCR